MSDPELDDDYSSVDEYEDAAEEVDEEEEEAGPPIAENNESSTNQETADGVTSVDDEEAEKSGSDSDSEDEFYNDDGDDRAEYVGAKAMTVIDRHVDDSFLQRQSEEELPRLIIIDAPNILHGSTPVKMLQGGETFGPAPESGREEKVGAEYLLAIVRFFVKNMFECVIVTPHKYCMPNITENDFIMTKLNNLGMMICVENHVYDDLVLFEVAAATDGVIVTQDKFRDHLAKQMPSSFRRAAEEYRVSPIYPTAKAHFLKKCDWGTISKNGHFLVDHAPRLEGSEEALRAIFFSSEATSDRHELVEECYRNWERRQDMVMKELDRLVAITVGRLAEQRKDCPEVLPRIG